MQTYDTLNQNTSKVAAWAITNNNPTPLDVFGFLTQNQAFTDQAIFSNLSKTPHAAEFVQLQEANVLISSPALEPVAQREANASISSVSLRQLQRLQIRYNFVNKKEVPDFIRANPQLALLLEEAIKPLRTSFRTEYLNLDIFHNPETPNFKQLVINIITKLPVNQALKELDKIDKGWWGKNINRAKGKLVIDLEFE
jgi:hypothetical protein